MACFARLASLLTPSSTAALLLAPLSLLPLACGDDVTTSFSDGGTASESEGETEAATGATTSAATTGTSTSAGPSGSDSDSESGTSDALTSGPTTGVTSEGETTVMTSGTSSSSSATGSTDGTSTGSTGSTGGDPTTDGTGSTGDTDTDTGGLIGVCDDDTLPYAGPLCGPPESPCALTANEAISPDHTFRNEAPAIALDIDCAPQVAYSVAVGGYHGYFARRVDDDSWESESTPMDLARVGLDYDPVNEHTYALAYGGAFNASLWSRDGGGQWSEEGAIAGQHIGSAYAFERDASGNFHAGLFNSGYVAEHGLWDGAWALQGFGAQSQQTTLALDPIDDTPNLTYWTSENLTWELMWATPDDGPEVVTALGSNVLEIQQHGVAVIPTDNDDPLPARPYVLLAIQQPGGLHTLALAHRVDVDSWSVEEIIAEDDDGASLCQFAPGGPGETCDFDYVRYLPLSVVASAGGDVRFVYRMTHHMGTLVSECVEFPFPQCWWNLQEDNSTAELRIGWPTEDGPEWVAFVDDVFATGLTMRVDADGVMHMAMYDTENIPDFMVRYLRLE